MATGILALLDDVSALVKVAASTLDDVPATVAKTTGKVSGIVIDDAAVTPKYVVGLDPKRELAIIWKIARWSFVNKLVILTPLALLLGYFAPWAITPLLMLGGAFLCYEGYGKFRSLIGGKKAHHAEPVEEISPEELERIRTASAVRTDFILSAEIVAIAYSTAAQMPLLTQAIVLFAVGVAVTIGVYGFVALLVKADDIGLWLATQSRTAAMRALGRGIVHAMPRVLAALSVIGTAAMLWVGAEIIVHGIPPVEHWFMDVKAALDIAATVGGALGAALAWAAQAFKLMIAGIAIGFVVSLVTDPLLKRFGISH